MPLFPVNIRITNPQDPFQKFEKKKYDAEWSCLESQPPVQKLNLDDTALFIQSVLLI